MSELTEELLRSKVLGASLEDGYAAMAADQEREDEAQEWCHALARDADNEARGSMAGELYS